ncbi:MAG: hypothetical protein AABY40_03940 [Nanoarchaeota archaeon]
MDLEKRLYGLLDNMRSNEMERAEKEGREYRMHGLCAVLGYNPEQHQPYFGFDAGKDIFHGKDVYLQDQEALQVLEEAMEIDGAILIGPDGKLMHSGKYMLPDMKEAYSKNKEALATYQYLQTVSDAGTRHIAAIALSSQQPDLLFYTLKSDHPELRVFKGGRIVRSSVAGEVENKTAAAYQAAVPEYT